MRRALSPLRTGLCRAADQMVAALAEEIHEQHAFRRVTVATLDEGTTHATTIVRGLNGSSRFDGYGIAKKMLAIARAELRRLGHDLSLDEVDGLLHHAEEHRSGKCRCRRKHIGGRIPRTAAEIQIGVRVRRESKTLCTRCGAASPTNGKVCRACLDYLVMMRREARARKRQPAYAPEELPY